MLYIDNQKLSRPPHKKYYWFFYPEDILPHNTLHKIIELYNEK